MYRIFSIVASSWIQLLEFVAFRRWFGRGVVAYEVLIEKISMRRHARDLAALPLLVRRAWPVKRSSDTAFCRRFSLPDRLSILSDSLSWQGQTQLHLPPSLALTFRLHAPSRSRESPLGAPCRLPAAAATISSVSQASHKVTGVLRSFTFARWGVVGCIQTRRDCIKYVLLVKIDHFCVRESNRLCKRPRSSRLSNFVPWSTHNQGHPADGDNRRCRWVLACCKRARSLKLTASSSRGGICEPRNGCGHRNSKRRARRTLTPCRGASERLVAAAFALPVSRLNRRSLRNGVVPAGTKISLLSCAR